MTNGIFGKKSSMGSADGIFQKKAGGKALGCVGCLSMQGLGDVTVPAQCWDKPHFKETTDQCLLEAQQTVANSGLIDTDGAAVKNLTEVCTQGAIDNCNAGLFDAKKTPPGYVTPPAKIPATPPAKTPVTPPKAGATTSLWEGSMLGLPNLAWVAVGGALVMVGVAKYMKASRTY